jgi:hypothetical protein
VWIPKSERDILVAIEAGDLDETSSFDARAALPMQGKSKDLAVDVAAMANAGGVLLYGVGEDEHGRPTIISPIKLHGAKERVDQIVRTSISEPPAIEIHEIPAENHAEVGYLVVTIPSSSRAPHMVTVGKDLGSMEEAPPVTYASRKETWLASMRGVGGGRLIVRRCWMTLLQRVRLSRTMISPIFILALVPWYSKRHARPG